MRRPVRPAQGRLLVRQFLTEFVEPDLSADADRHQVLAVAAAAIVTLPLFASVFMGWRYLLRPLQSPGWTAVASSSDAAIFCAASMLIAAILAAVEWHALSLSEKDAAILGVLPIPRGLVVGAKLQALVTFCGLFVLALNAVSMLVHPIFMLAGLKLLSPFMIPPVMAAHVLAAGLAGAFGFWSVVALRECLYFAAGPHAFQRLSEMVRSGLLFGLLLALLLTPMRLAGSSTWMMGNSPPPLVVRPVLWFASIDAAIVGHIFQRVPERPLSPRARDEERRLKSTAQQALPSLAARAWWGLGALAMVFALASGTYSWNATRVPKGPAPSGPPRIDTSRLADDALALGVRRPATRAGVLFLARTMTRSPVHRAYSIVAVAAGTALLIAMGLPGIAEPGDDLPRTADLAAQTLLLAIAVGGFRAAIRTSAGDRAEWVFRVAEVGYGRHFRNGIRLGAVAAVVAIVSLLAPVYAAAWGTATAVLHAVNGAALGWLLVELAMVEIDRPLISTIPSSDGLNTAGVVLIGVTLAAVVVLAKIERNTMESVAQSVLFAPVIALAAIVRWRAEQSG